MNILVATGEFADPRIDMGLNLNLSKSGFHRLDAKDVLVVELTHRAEGIMVEGYHIVI